MLAGQHYMEAITFSDESRICIGPYSRWVWRKYGDTDPLVYAPTEKFPNGLMVFGAVGPGYKSNLGFVEGTEDANGYVDIISSLIPSLDEAYGVNKYIFQQDGATPHTSSKAAVFLNVKC